MRPDSRCTILPLVVALLLAPSVRAEDIVVPLPQLDGTYTSADFASVSVEFDFPPGTYQLDSFRILADVQTAPGHLCCYYDLDPTCDDHTPNLGLVLSGLPDCEFLWTAIDADVSTGEFDAIPLRFGPGDRVCPEDLGAFVDATATVEVEFGQALLLICHWAEPAHLVISNARAVFQGSRVVANETDSWGSIKSLFR